MQDELDRDHPALGIRILGVNQAGYESGNAAAVAGRDLPLLQDTTAVNAWAQWGATWRDVYIVDRDNQKVEVYNLTTYDLSNPTYYAELRDKFIAAAQP